MKKLLIPLFLLSAVFLDACPAFAAAQKIVIVSGDSQWGIENFPLKEDFVVQVLSGDNAPLAGVPVAFTVVGRPAAMQEGCGTEPSLSSALALTDGQGCARTRLNLGSRCGGRVLVSASTRDTIGDPAVFQATTHRRNWILLITLETVGGLGLFLFGIFYINDGLRKIAGHKLKEFLVALTRSPRRGIGTGLFVTLFNQSSSATVLLEVSLVSAGLLTFYQTMAVTMGAEIGSTATAQLVAFKLSDYAILIAGFGFYMALAAKSKKWKHTGNVIFGVGMLFLGMKLITDLLSPLRYYGPFMDAMKSVENPLFGIAVGLVFTMLVHSSGATAGIVIALALSGAMTLGQAIPVNLGAQIGTCFTAWLGALGRGKEGKRVALWHVIHQTAGVVLIYPFLVFITWHGQPAWIAFVTWFTRTLFYTTDVARQIAMAHTLGAIFNALLFLPLLPLMHRLLCAAYPGKEEEKPFGPVFIEEEFLPTPALALAQARKEIVREGEIVLDMMEESLRVFELQDLKLLETVSLKDIRADILRNAIIPYLTKIGQGGALTEEQSRQEIQLLYITADIEAIGDIVDKNILPLARKKLENKLWFSDEGWKDIVDLHRRVTDNMVFALNALRENNEELARLVTNSKPEINRYESELRKRHIGRLHSGLQESLETSSVHLDLIDQFKRINSHTSSIGYALLGQM